MFRPDELLKQTLALIAQRRQLPSATYRLQFHQGFTFQDAQAVSAYLHDLGVSHAYASPYLKAKAGSTHGYDVIDHHHLNPEVGSDEQFNAWIDSLRERGMGHILDVVPNHVGVATNDNPWWNDVLEHGSASPYAAYFDIAWRGSPRPQMHDKVLLPLLGQPYAQVLEAGQLQLAFEEGGFAIYYYDRRFPISPRSYGRILGHQIDRLVTNDAASEEFRTIVSYFTRSLSISAEEMDALKRRLQRLTSSPRIREFIEDNVSFFNGLPGEAASFDALDALLTEQNYRLAYWQIASDEINYRRFFDVNELAALSMEKPEVFDSTHELIFQLLGQDKLQGLRVDHPDGLFDPKQYFERLQQRYVLAIAQTLFRQQGGTKDEWPTIAGSLSLLIAEKPSTDPPLYVVAEKILAMDEPLPDDWAVHGTSGYDFLNFCNGLFVDESTEEAFTRIYQGWIGDQTPFAELVYQKKLLILEISLASELQMLSHRLDELAQAHRATRDFTHNSLRLALRETIACFPVYRSYVTCRGLSSGDEPVIRAAIEEAIRRNPKRSPQPFRFLEQVLLAQGPDQSEAGRKAQLHFAGKFQQLTAPVTAKGIEDTAFYIFNRLVSLNEVGGDPEQFGVTPARLHRYLSDRQKRWPYAMSALSTHDTKRGEDVRARINVLSEMPEEWQAHLTRWASTNDSLRRQVNGRPAPDRNEEYLIYQTLLGAWPFDATSADDVFVKRMGDYLVKAMREAKVNTTWINPNNEHEAAVQAFIAEILDPEKGQAFLKSFLPFQRKLSDLGVFNSLAQTLLRITAPGVPDTYQGTELWNLSLVDPDNRRPVDYSFREQMLRELSSIGAHETPCDDLQNLLTHPADGRIKLFVTWRALQARRTHPELFTIGDYHPVQPRGAMARHVFAFARTWQDQAAIVVVPRLLSRVLKEDGSLPLRDFWQSTHLNLPMLSSGGKLQDVFTGQRLQAEDAFPRTSLLCEFPLALLITTAS